MSFDERSSRIMDIATTDYAIATDKVSDYLHAINGASINDQKRLFRLILTVHNARVITKFKEGSKNSISLERWKRAVEELHDTVLGWVEETTGNNSSLNQTADILWDKISLCGGTINRTIALSMFLEQSRVVPYAPIPKDLPEVKEDSIYEDATDFILDKIAVLNRTKNGASFVSYLKVSVVLVDLLDQISNKDDRAALINYFFVSLAKEAEEGPSAYCPVCEQDDGFPDTDEDDDEDGDEGESWKTEM